MPKHVLNMLDAIKDNGGSDDIKALGAGVRELLVMVDEDRRLRRTMYKCMDEHLKDKTKHLSAEGGCKVIQDHLLDTESHTPKGIILRKGVIVYFVLSVGLITGIVQYIPELVRWLMAL